MGLHGNYSGLGKSARIGGHQCNRISVQDLQSQVKLGKLRLWKYQSMRTQSISINTDFSNDKLQIRRKHRFVWMGFRWTGRSLSTKKDLEDYQGPGLVPEEPVPGEMFFIPNPEGVEEDDGVLVTYFCMGIRRRSPT